MKKGNLFIDLAIMGFGVVCIILLSSLLLSPGFYMTFSQGGIQQKLSIILIIILLLAVIILAAVKTFLFLREVIISRFS